MQFCIHREFGHYYTSEQRLPATSPFSGCISPSGMHGNTWTLYWTPGVNLQGPHTFVLCALHPSHLICIMGSLVTCKYNSLFYPTMLLMIQIDSHDSHPSQIYLERLNGSQRNNHLGSKQTVKVMDDAKFMHLLNSFVKSYTDL